MPPYSQNILVSPSGFRESYRERQKGDNDNLKLLLPSSLGKLDATPLWETEARRHKRNKDIASDVCLGCSDFPWAGADLSEPTIAIADCE